MEILEPRYSIRPTSRDLCFLVSSALCQGAGTLKEKDCF